MMLYLLAIILIAQGTTISDLMVTSQQIPKNIFILAGQSNMAGRGGVVNDTKTGIPRWDGIVPPQSQPNPSIFKLSSSLTWILAHEPLHSDIDYNKTNGVGPGMAFANAVLTKDPDIGTVGLVPCAIGGTSMSQWEKGGFLYDQLVQRTRAALSSGGVVRAMLWYQGESDTLYEEDADAYKWRLEKFFTDVRADLHHPFLPIYQVALASGEGPFIETIREAQKGMKQANLHCVDAKGLPLEPDRLHLTSPAQVYLGQMLADAFLRARSTPIRTTITSYNSSTTLSIFSSGFIINTLYLLLLSLVYT
ncbi:probable carbohydrate esterase At4g34215 [Mercurialis annua]|uniref:probable carbohydrate esterase At4g34215 n=1 Tax=Mercurialis annua TaxID=3986 RepID=UPI00215FED74|nr:probable carbohydrate esterase At4g34215 [Mercurialis annua]